ncbi:MAG TPA: FtsW/RodA/SpoVE family cell cycle protein [Clostridiaceae bacterium]|nr:FtsW/RodA/SpoVE family cell cycle protein [Clostridiaceae bacterium]
MVKSYTRFVKPVYLVVLINLMGFLLLYMYSKPYDNITIFAGFSVIALICLTYALILKLEMGDEYLFLIVSMLMSIGIIMLYRLGRDLALKQIIWLAVGITMFFACYFAYLKLNIWDKVIYIYPIVSYILFIITIVFGGGKRGATNWIAIGGISVQSSEIIKVLYVFFLASYYTDPDKLNNITIAFKRPNIKINISRQWIFIALNYIFIGFLFLQRELGTAFLFFGVFIFFLFIFGSKLTTLVFNAVVACAGLVFSYFYFYHIRVRFDTWINPWSDISNKGYQITQSLFAIGSGGFFGTGLGLGRPDFVPEVHTDFIFSAICEEMGIFGGIAVIFLFFIFAYRGFKISLMVNETFDRIVALGITLMFALQTFIILGGVIKLIPLTGITLPFISYGGSSLVSGFISLGILQAISRKA